MEKQSLFISYSWKDGSIYADELENQLNEEFNVKRDKSQLIVNDDIYEFMSEIARCDNVIIVLTEEYVKSLNCMLEMSYLVSQDDWSMKAMVLVIDDSLYSVDRKIEIINYWKTRKRFCLSGILEDDGKTLWEDEKSYIDQICDQVEPFFRGISRRKNPSQIAIVNEVIKRSKRDKSKENDLISKGEELVRKVISKKGNVTIKELTEETGRSQASVRRLVSNLLEKGSIEKVGDNNRIHFVLKG